jgi:transcriptional regulator of acetoin/glycerol metabolism
VNRAFDRSIRLHRIADHDLELRLERNQRLIEAATRPLKTFSAAMSGIQHVIYITDRDGIVLFSAGNDEIMMMYGLLPGYDWSEKRMGTNGAGTALASGKAVAVVGTDHYQLPFHESTCLAAPIRDAAGELIGAVDFSTHVNDARPSQLMQIVAVASAIEKSLAGLGQETTVMRQAS